MNEQTIIHQGLQKRAELFTLLAGMTKIHEILARVADELERRFRCGGELLVAGNGGSLADSMHLGGELVAQFMLARRSLPVTVLGGNPAVMSAIANDDAYMRVHTRELSGRLRKENALLILSTSGNSKNQLALRDMAHNAGMATFAFLGKGGGAIGAQDLDQRIVIPSDQTDLIQEAHKALIHILCHLLDQKFQGT